LVDESKSLNYEYYNQQNALKLCFVFLSFFIIISGILNFQEWYPPTNGLQICLRYLFHFNKNVLNIILTTHNPQLDCNIRYSGSQSILLDNIITLEQYKTIIMTGPVCLIHLHYHACLFWGHALSTAISVSYLLMKRRYLIQNLF